MKAFYHLAIKPNDATITSLRLLKCGDDPPCPRNFRRCRRKGVVCRVNLARMYQSFPVKAEHCAIETFAYKTDVVVEFVVNPIQSNQLPASRRRR